MPSLKRLVLNNYAFDANKQALLGNRAIEEHDYLKVFVMCYIDPDRNKLDKLSFDCLINFLKNKPIAQALQQLNDKFTQIFKKYNINTNDADVQEFFRALDDFIYQLPRKPLEQPRQAIKRK